MTIASKLQLTLNNKNAVKLALQNKGANPTDVFSTYAGLIDGLATSGIATPQIISPINGATGVAQSPIVTGSRFSGLDPDGFADVHVASTWEFASDSAFTNILHTSGRDTVNLESYDCSAAGFSFDGGVTVYARVTYEGQSGNVATSAAVSFETVLIAPGVVIDGDIVVDQLNGYWILAAPATKRAQMAWGLYDTDTSLPNISDAATPDPNSGEYNTDTLVNSYGSSATAADYCRNQLDKPYDLPNKEELDFLYQHYAAIDAADESGGANTFASFGSSYIWSSTEYSSIGAWIQRFSDGSQFSSTNKDGSYWVAPIRSIPV